MKKCQILSITRKLIYVSFIYVLKKFRYVQTYNMWEAEDSAKTLDAGQGKVKAAFKQIPQK